MDNLINRRNAIGLAGALCVAGAIGKPLYATENAQRAEMERLNDAVRQARLRAATHWLAMEQSNERDLRAALLR